MGGALEKECWPHNDPAGSQYVPLVVLDWGAQSHSLKWKCYRGGALDWGGEV